VGFVTFLLNPGPTTACRKSMSHSQPLFVAGRHINTLLRTHVKEITSHILAWLFSSCSRTCRSWNRQNSKHFLSINMQQSYRLFVLTTSYKDKLNLYFLLNFSLRKLKNIILISSQGSDALSLLCIRKFLNKVRQRNLMQHVALNTKAPAPTIVRLS